MLKDGSVLRVSNVVAVAEADFTDGFVKQISWTNPAALEVELENLLRRKDTETGASNALMHFVHTTYRSIFINRFLIDMANRIFSDAEIRQVCPDYADPAPKIAREMEQSREYLDLFATEHREMPEAELRRRFEAHFDREFAVIPPEERMQLLIRSMREWRERAERSNLMAVRRHLLTGINRDYSSKSNVIWATERSNWIRRVYYTKMAQQLHMTPPTLQLTNQFLWPRAKRYPCVSLFSEKVGALAPFQLDLLGMPKAEAMIGRLALLVSRSEKWIGNLRTNQLAATSLVRIDPTIKPLEDLPRLIYRTVQAEEYAACHDWVNRALLPPPPLEVLLILSPPTETLAESMAKLPEAEWRKFLAGEGVIQAVYANIRGQFETINTNLFPTPESVRSWLPPEGMSAFLRRSH